MKRFLRKLFGSASTPTFKHQRVRPQFESLEDRALMAGDVTAYISGSTLFIEGDEANNHIEIFEQSDGSIKIENTESSNPYYVPINNYSYYGNYYYGGVSKLSNSYYTLINGKHSDTISGSFSNIKVLMSGGNDSVDFHDVDVPWDLEIDMGSGGDDVDVDDVTTGDDLIIRSGGGGTVFGKDDIRVTDTHVGSSSSTNNDLYIYGSNGLEEVAVINVTAEDDMLIYLTKEGEGDRAFLSNGNRVLGDYSRGTTRVDSDFIYVHDLETEGDGDFRYASYLEITSSDFGDDLWVDGTSQADTMVFSNLSVNDLADIDALGGNDTITVSGSKGFHIDGGSGDDEITGGSGSDTLLGNSGSDTILGGSGADEINGGTYRDHLYGEGGNDTIKGGSGDDFINGGSGHDKLYGEGNRDGIYGGTGNDTMDGGSSADRFLILRDHDGWFGPYSDDVIQNMSSSDVEVFFENFDQTTVTLNGNNSTTFSAGTWTDQHVEWVDDALYVMVRRTGNNGLINDGMVLGRVGTNQSGNGFTAYNSFGTSVFSNAAFNNQNNAMRIIFHEIGHNWDNENPYWSDFQEISGWTQAIAWWDTTPYTESIDFQWVTNQWWFKTSEDDTFARNYGKTNPMEDFATVFAAYLMEWGSNNTEYDFLNYNWSTGDIDEKVELISDWLDEV